MSMFDAKDFVIAKLRILHIEDTHLGPKAMHRMLRALRKIKELEELHLVYLEELEIHLEVLTESLKNTTHLKVLDLRQKGMRKRDVGPLVPFLA